MSNRVLLCLGLILSAASCAGGSRNEGDQADSTSEGLAPAGSDAAFVSASIKPSWSPGERGVISVTMQNTGDIGPTNDWSTTAPIFSLSSRDWQWGWGRQVVRAPVLVGDNYTFSFPVTAPNTLGASTLTAGMRAAGLGDFGALVAIPLTVSTLSVPEWGCSYVSAASTLPTTLAVDENRTVTVTVQNSGTGTWLEGFHFIAKDTPADLWSRKVALKGPVVSGDTTSFTFSIHAPLVPGSYRLKREMADLRPGGVGAFRASGFCVDVPIEVAGTSSLASTLGTQSFPGIMAPGEPVRVTANLVNTGTETWQADGNYSLKSANSPRGLWGTSGALLTTSTVTGATASLTFVVTAPSAPGSYLQRWQMSKSAGSNSGLFGSITDVPVVVSASATPGYGASVVSQTVLSTMTAGQTYPVSIVMKNTGSNTWQGNTFGLRSVTHPKSVWKTSRASFAPEDQVAPGAEYTFTFDVIAPASPGTYSSLWRMNQSDGVGPFGEPAATDGIMVTSVLVGDAHDCAELLGSNSSLPNGIYPIDIDGAAGAMAAFDVYCDMANGGWTQLNDQDVNVSGGFLNSSTWLGGVNTTLPNGGQWGILNHLVEFVRSTGDYEFRMTYGQDESTSTTWVQTGNPLSGDRGTISALVMTPPNQSGCNPFSGLAADDGIAALDGDPGGCWWFPIGSAGSFGGGIPAYGSSDGGELVTDRARLYVRR